MKTSNPARWYRMYAEFATDPKVQMLSEQDQRRYIMLLCLRCGNGDVTLQDSEVAFQLRIAEQEWLITKAVLLSKCLINELSKPASWDKRQFVSDSSTERVAAHRERSKETCNVTVTPPETETETETETEEVKSIAQKNSATSTKLSGFAEFWTAYPRKKNKGDAEKAWTSIKPSESMQAEIISAVLLAKVNTDWLKNGGEFIPYPASWLRAKGWEDSAPMATYNADAVAVLESYNTILGLRGWPEAVVDPFSQERSGSICVFLGMSSRESWVDAYFGWLADNLTPKPGCGFDWAIKRETFLRARESNFSSMAEAA